MGEYLIFDKRTKCNFSKWYFPELDNYSEVLRPQVIKDIIKDVAETIDDELRKDTTVYLWDNGRKKPNLVIRIRFPLGKTDDADSDVGASVSLEALVKDCIDLEVDNDAEMSRWGFGETRLRCLVVEARQDEAITVTLEPGERIINVTTGNRLWWVYIERPAGDEERTVSDDD